MIKNFFEKDINRPIETVIKADDREHISDEVVEYVVTNEIGKKIKDLFSGYNEYAGANGVWISGFFGSGKSHLLKILSYVLENKVAYDGYNTGELFAEKVENDEVLKADILRASRIPSESVLFNIDQQSQITSKSDENAVLSVFYKVFFDHLGYYGFQPHVAEFEMWLDKQEQYDTFKTNFNIKNGNSWEEARLDYFDPMVTDHIAEVLGELNNMDASKYENILEDLEDRQKQSIEDFAERVNNYLKTKSSGFRLNFFVDEVGQYISDNTKLMLNLQTIAETLATRTHGKSWILVTSQEDMEKVVGDMNKQQQNDFSRIQARFKIKVPLTSANVDEVIEKRILKKNDDAQKQLAASYKKESAHLESLLSFSDAGVQFKGYSDGKDYANKFPLVPYQFDLFQQCRRALSGHNAFQGKHASVGERSMLGVFQQVIQQIEDKDDKALVSFDLMFEGIRNELRGEIQSSVIMAERNLDDVFAKQILKALFLVKYFKNFKTTKRNISVLMINDINIDIKKHEQKIDKALNLLENQNYVQRNGDLYEFLTDDERDIEDEIKNTEIDDSAITQLLKEILFDEIIRDNRIKYIGNKQDYDFTSKIDGVVLGREKELEIEIITENYNNYENVTYIQSQTMGSTGMKMVLSPDAVFMKDVKMYLKTDKYVKQNRSTSNSTGRKHILQEKAQLNADRRRNLILIAKNSLAKSTVYMNGSKHEMSQAADGKTRVINAFQDLIKIVYASLRMLATIQYSEDTIKTTVFTKIDELFKADDNTISEPESEVLNIINRRKKQADRTSLNDLKSHFLQKPYGWYPNAIWTITARLYKRGKIEMMQGSNILEDQDVLNAFLNSSKHLTTLLEPQASFDVNAVKKLKQVYKEAFDVSCSSKEPKDVANDFKSKIKEMAIDVNQLLARKKEYHFLQTLEGFSEQLDRLSNKGYSYFITNLGDFEDDLLDTKENLLDPIKRFINGDQVKIYNDIKTLLSGNTANLSYIDGDEVNTLEMILETDTPYRGNGIQLAKASKDSLTEKVLDAIQSEREIFNTKITAIEKAIEVSYEFGRLNDGQKGEIQQTILDYKNKVKEERFIGNIRNMTHEVEDKLYNDQMNLMAKWLAPKPEPGEVQEPIQAKYIKRSSIYIPFGKHELTSEEDVEKYVEASKKAYLNRIRQNLKITI
jgi:hypothetical protein